MKLGTSYSRCLRDIVDGAVNIDEVMVIIARTNFDPEDDAQWEGIWRGYATAAQWGGSVWSHPEWSNYQDREKEFRDLSIRLKQSGKLHQPRQFGAHPQRWEDYWYDLVLTSSVHEANPAVKRAWDNYKLIAGLAK
jgi:hypothetical protein